MHHRLWNTNLRVFPGTSQNILNLEKHERIYKIEVLYCVVLYLLYLTSWIVFIFSHQAMLIWKTFQFVEKSKRIFTQNRYRLKTGYLITPCYILKAEYSIIKTNSKLVNKHILLNCHTYKYKLLKQVMTVVLPNAWLHAGVNVTRPRNWSYHVCHATQ